MDAETIYKKLTEMDTLREVEVAFANSHAKQGAAWAIESMAADIFAARQVARLVRPLIEARADLSDEEWLVRARATKDSAARQLLDGHWRHNSTSMLQNAVNQWESEALSKFVWLMGRYLS